MILLNEDIAACILIELSLDMYLEMLLQVMLSNEAFVAIIAVCSSDEFEHVI